MVAKLFNEVSKAAANRPGGYTRTASKCGFRPGDQAPMADSHVVNSTNLKDESAE